MVIIVNGVYKVSNHTTPLNHSGIATCERRGRASSPTKCFGGFYRNTWRSVGNLFSQKSDHGTLIKLPCTRHSVIHVTYNQLFLDYVNWLILELSELAMDLSTLLKNVIIVSMW